MGVLIFRFLPRMLESVGLIAKRATAVVIKSLFQ
jgi:hypothetical protein